MLVGTSTRNAVSCCNKVASRAPISGSPSTGRTATLVTFKSWTASLDWSCSATHDCSNGPKITLLSLIESTDTNATQAPARQPCSRKDPVTTRLRVMARTQSRRLPARTVPRSKVSVIESSFMKRYLHKRRALLNRASHTSSNLSRYLLLPTGQRKYAPSIPLNRGSETYSSMNKMER